MREETAVELAVGLMHLPSRARALRDAPLPRDVDALLNIVAGEGRVLADAARDIGLTEDAIREAAGFYIEQILLHPDADSYRALGTSSDAKIDELRRNMALLLRWLHPDREANGPRSIYVGRITEAWNNIKTAERRSAYDEGRKSVVANKYAHRQSGVGSGAARSSNGRADIRPVRPPVVMRAGGSGSHRARRKRRGRLWRILERLLGQDLR